MPISIRTLTKVFKLRQNTATNAIARCFGTGYTYYESWIESLAYVRNLCAHYGRLYNAKLTKTPKLYDQDRKIGIGNNRIFGVLICMEHILGKDKGWKSFVNSLDPHVKKDTMGFPANWKEILT